MRSSLQPLRDLLSRNRSPVGGCAMQLGFRPTLFPATSQCTEKTAQRTGASAYCLWGRSFERLGFRPDPETPHIL
jgi:hypothetical protein